MTETAYRVPNAIFAILHMPYGIVSGFFTITLGFLMAQAGIGTEAIAGIAALCLFPLTWSVVWAPVVDFTLSYRAWYLIGTAAVALGIFLTGLVPVRPAFIFLLGVLAFGACVASTFTAQVAAAFAARQPGQKGGAAGWFMAGSIGGNGAGGGLGLWIAHHTGGTPRIAAAVLALICLACCSVVVLFREPVHHHRAPRLSATLHNIWRDILALACSRDGLLAFTLLLLPIGTGAASYLWSAVAGDWHAGADLVALATGLASGAISAFGALLMGRLCDRFGAKTSYLACGALMGAITVAMALAPRTPVMFAIFTMAYALSNGGMYASFAAVMLEAIGTACAATKAPVMTCLTNVPILIMTMIEGHAQVRWGSGGMLAVEAAMTVASVLLFIPFAVFLRARTAAA